RARTFAGTFTFISLDSSRPFFPRLTKSFSRKLGLRMPIFLPGLLQSPLSTQVDRGTDAVRSFRRGYLHVPRTHLSELRHNLVLQVAEQHATAPPLTVQLRSAYRLGSAARMPSRPTAPLHGAARLHSFFFNWSRC